MNDMAIRVDSKKQNRYSQFYGMVVHGICNEKWMFNTVCSWFVKFDATHKSNDGNSADRHTFVMYI